MQNKPLESLITFTYLLCHMSTNSTGLPLNIHGLNTSKVQGLFYWIITYFITQSNTTKKKLTYMHKGTWKRYHQVKENVKCLLFSSLSGDYTGDLRKT